MVTDKRYRINTYVQLLKYIEDTEERNRIIGDVLNMLDEISAEKEERAGFFFEEYDFRYSGIRTLVKRLVDEGITKLMSVGELFKYAEKYDIKITTDKMRTGSFLSKHRTDFAVEDNIGIIIKRRGTGSNLYKFVRVSESEE